MFYQQIQVQTNCVKVLILGETNLRDQGATCTSLGCTAAVAPADNVSFDPQCCSDFSLKPNSPATNAGNPAILNLGGTRSDLGAYGRPEAIVPSAQCGTPPLHQTAVVLVHGWCGDPSSFGNMATLLSSDSGLMLADPFDYSAFTKVPVSGQQGLSIEELASLFAVHIRKQLAAHPEVTQVDVVAHSMGGLIVRAWVTGMTSVAVPYNGEIRRVVFIGTPNFGASLAQLATYSYFAQYVLSLHTIACSGTQAAEMQFGSPFLMNLYDRWNTFEATSSNAIHSEDLLFLAGTKDGT